MYLSNDQYFVDQDVTLAFGGYGRIVPFSRNDKRLDCTKDDTKNDSIELNDLNIGGPDLVAKIHLFPQEQNIDSLFCELVMHDFMHHHSPNHSLFEGWFDHENAIGIVLRRCDQSMKTMSDIDFPHFEHVIETLCFLHSFYIAHGDPKLENILYDVEKQLFYLVDYTFVLRQGHYYLHHSTLEYKSPEADDDTKNHETFTDILACDVYALGKCMEKVGLDCPSALEHDPKNRICISALAHSQYANRFSGWLESEYKIPNTLYANTLSYELGMIKQKTIKYILHQVRGQFDHHTIFGFLDLADRIVPMESDIHSDILGTYSRLIMSAFILSEKINQVYCFSNKTWISILPWVIDIPGYLEKHLYNDMIYIMKTVPPRYLIRSPNNWSDLLLYFSEKENFSHRKEPQLVLGIQYTLVSI